MAGLPASSWPRASWEAAASSSQPRRMGSTVVNSLLPERDTCSAIITTAKTAQHTLSRKQVCYDPSAMTAHNGNLTHSLLDVHRP